MLGVTLLSDPSQKVLFPSRMIQNSLRPLLPSQGKILRVGAATQNIWESIYPSLAEDAAVASFPLPYKPIPTLDKKVDNVAFHSYLRPVLMEIALRIRRQIGIVVVLNEEVWLVSSRPQEGETGGLYDSLRELSHLLVMLVGVKDGQFYLFNLIYPSNPPVIKASFNEKDILTASKTAITRIYSNLFATTS